MSAWIDLAGKKNADSAMRESGFERVEGDRYWTEAWVTKALLSRVKFRGTIWEPACGRGDMANVLVDHGYAVMISDIAGATLGCAHASEIDFLTATSPGDGELSIVTNPPYTHAEAFIRKALKITERASGMVAMLLRNEYDCATRRRPLFERESFAAKYVLTKRPKWADGIGQHNASPRHNFAWFVWDHNHSGSAKIEWLP
jgi:hypothetical protein